MDAVETCGLKIKNGITYEELFAGGTMELEGARPDFDSDIFNGDNDLYDDDVDIIPDNVKLKKNPSYGDSFEKFREGMVKIDEFMHKHVLEEGDRELPKHAEVTIHYNAYLEGAEIPFDSTYTRQPMHISVESNNVIPGLLEAVKTMRRKEKSQFLIHYNLLYGEHGCPPRIPPKSDILYVITLIDVKELTQLAGLNNETETEFLRRFNEASLLDNKAKEAFDRQDYNAAVTAYRNSIGKVENCNLKDAEEEKLQTNFLAKQYCNSALCYNKLGKPKKACTAINELNKLRPIYNNSKALYIKGCALTELNDFTEAHKLLTKALELRPNNEHIINARERLSARENKYKAEQKAFFANMFNLTMPKPKENEDDGAYDNIKECILSFRDTEMETLMLDDNLTDSELGKLKNLDPNLGVELETVPTENGLGYRLRKTRKM